MIAIDVRVEILSNGVLVTENNPSKTRRVYKDFEEFMESEVLNHDAEGTEFIIVGKKSEGGTENIEKLQKASSQIVG